MKITKQQLKQLIQEEMNVITERHPKYAAARSGEWSDQQRQALLDKGYVEDPDDPNMLYLPHGATDGGGQPAGGADLKNEVAALEKALNQIKAKLGMA